MFNPKNARNLRNKLARNSRNSWENIKLVKEALRKMLGNPNFSKNQDVKLKVEDLTNILVNDSGFTMNQIMQGISDIMSGNPKSRQPQVVETITSVFRPHQPVPELEEFENVYATVNKPPTPPNRSSSLSPNSGNIYAKLHFPNPSNSYPIPNSQRTEYATLKEMNNENSDNEGNIIGGAKKRRTRRKSTKKVTKKTKKTSKKVTKKSKTKKSKAKKSNAKKISKKSKKSKRSTKKKAPRRRKRSGLFGGQSGATGMPLRYYKPNASMASREGPVPSMAGGKKRKASKKSTKKLVKKAKKTKRSTKKRTSK